VLCHVDDWLVAGKSTSTHLQWDTL
jgi:hypothetical protein